MIMRVLIADDEPLARDRLRKLLRSEPDIRIVGECAAGKETVAAIALKNPDLVLLDVNMPEQNGFGVIASLDRLRLPLIIVVTAHEHFALQAFDSQVIDYLLKPVDPARFRKALTRAREKLTPVETHASIPPLSESPSPVPPAPFYTDRFAVRTRDRIVVVKSSEIDWIQSADNYVELHVKSSIHMLRQPLSKLIHQLSPGQFLRINRSIVVNIDFVSEFRTKSHGDYLVALKNGTKLTGSRKYRKGLQGLLGKETTNFQ